VSRGVVRSGRLFVDGVNGTDGVDGTDGLDGMNGTDGLDGMNGADGVDEGDAVPDASDVSGPGPVRVPAALPVELALDEARFTGLRRFVEGELGWQAVDPDAGRLVPPRLILLDLVTATAGEHVDGPHDRRVRIPRVLVLGVDDDVQRLATVMLDVRADAAVVWPGDRDRLEGTVARLLAAPADTSSSDALRIGGSGGGVGTTTVALAVGGLAAWTGTPTLVAVRGAGSGAPIVPAAALAGTGVWGRAEPLAGIARARAVRLVDHGSVPEPTDPGVGLFVLDAGVDPEVDVLVCRRDAAALQTLPVTTAGVIVVIGDGPASMRLMRRAAAGRPAVVLPWSARVARAGLAGRIPAGLPGSFVQRLRAVLPQQARSGERSDDGRERTFGSNT
jgi:hypothetical protein